MATQADLAKRVLRRLQVLQAGETPDADDDAITDEAIVSVYAELEEYGLAYFELTDIPEAVMLGMIRMVASEVAPEFNVETPSTLAERSIGERMIRRVVASQGDDQTIPQIYF